MPRNTFQNSPSIERSVEEETVDAGDTLEVTVTTDVDNPSIYTLQEETEDSDALTISDPQSDFEPGEVLTEDGRWAAAVTEENAESLELTYTIEVASDAAEDEYELSGTLVTEDEEFDTGTTTITVETSGPSLDDYTDSEGNVPTPNLLEAITDWQNDDIETMLLLDVITAWQQTE